MMIYMLLVAFVMFMWISLCATSFKIEPSNADFLAMLMGIKNTDVLIIYQAKLECPEMLFLMMTISALVILLRYMSKLLMIHGFVILCYMTIRDPVVDAPNQLETDNSIIQDAPSRFSGLVYTRRGAPPTPSHEAPPLRRSTRERHPIHRWVSYNNFSLDFQLFLTNVAKEKESSTFHQAAHSRAWVEA
ncbi:hypothetical protein QML37_29980, partial [Klebsiella pneumoniae]|uniref:hypothetical protein n=1 Tax=Klebsiella pneumoniae TaxID=573 RepID=UPI003A7FDF8C